MKKKINHQDAKTPRRPLLEVYGDGGPGEGGFFQKDLSLGFCLPLFFVSWCLCGALFLSAAAHAYTGRRAVLYTRGEAMLAENLPWIKQDCSSAMWRMIRDLWPELKLVKWFHRTTAAAMASWPWPPVMSLERTIFGDLLFANGKKDDPRKWSLAQQMHIGHVMMRWDRAWTAVHASSSKGFSETDIRPYWVPRINLAIRPPL